MEAPQGQMVAVTVKVEMVTLGAINKPEPKPEGEIQDVGILLEKSGGTVPLSKEIGGVAQTAVNVVTSSELAIGDVYILLLGNDSQNFTQYVEIVMSAYKHLGQMG